MDKQKVIKIRSSLHKEISTHIVINGEKYLILTEDLDPEKHIITTKVYLGGEIILTRNIDCKKVLNMPEQEKKINELIRGHHKTVVEILRKKYKKKVRKPPDYLDEIKDLLQKKNNKAALELLNLALDQYPDEPFLLSYYGCLEAIINKNYAHGIEVCLNAIKMLEEKVPFGQEIFYPTFYLNLGRAYFAAQKKKEAVKAYQKGLAFDKENKDIIWEMKKLGMRKMPVIPYLRRSNPINKYIGMMLHVFGRDSS